MEILSVVLLFVLMVAVGLELALDDFRRVAEAPRAVIVATLGQVTLLPFSIGALLYFGDFSPTLVAGAMIITVAPGAGVSNLFTLLAGANVALSVTLTAMGSLLAVFSIPILLSLGFDFLLGETMEISMPVLPMMSQLAGFVLVPIATGMWVRQRRPDVVDWLRPVLRWALVIGFIGIVVIATTTRGGDFEAVGDEIAPGFLLAFFWTVAAVVAGGVTAFFAAGRTEERFAIVIEFAAKNGTVAALVAIGSLERLDFALFSVLYPAVAYPIVGLAVWGYRRQGARKNTAAALG